MVMDKENNWLLLSLASRSCFGKLWIIKISSYVYFFKKPGVECLYQTLAENRQSNQLQKGKLSMVMENVTLVQESERLLIYGYSKILYFL